MPTNPLKPLPHAFRRIRLELAREPGHPLGEPQIGYEILAPLLADGHLDVETARIFFKECRVARFRDHGEVEIGYLRRRPGGSWAIHYKLESGEDDDDPAYRLGEHLFVEGEYITIEEDEGSHTYKVSRVARL